MRTQELRQKKQSNTYPQLIAIRNLQKCLQLFHFSVSFDTFDVYHFTPFSEPSASAYYVIYQYQRKNCIWNRVYLWMCGKQKTVITTKSVEYMPFFLSFFLFLNGGVWAVYAIFDRDIFLGVNNLTYCKQSYLLLIFSVATTCSMIQQIKWKHENSYWNMDTHIQDTYILSRSLYCWIDLLGSCAYLHAFSVCFGLCDVHIMLHILLQRTYK